MRALFDVIFGPINSLLGSIPLGAARWVTVLFLIIPVLVIARLPRSYVLRGSPDRRRVRDLRLWAALFILPYVLIYLFA